MKKFKIELNLDNPVELLEFLSNYWLMDAKTLAAEFGWEGEGAVPAVIALQDYAEYKLTAIRRRLNGQINCACSAERECDEIYRQRIQPNIDCW